METSQKDIVRCMIDSCSPTQLASRIRYCSHNRKKEEGNMAPRSQNKSTKTFAAVFEKTKKRKREEAASSKTSHPHGDHSTNNASPTSADSRHPKPQLKKKKQRPPKKRNAIKSNAGKQEGNGGFSSSAGGGSKYKKKLSQEALDLSSKLKEFSQRKQLNQALGLYWDKANDGIRDGFHACIAIDCCARCGAMQVSTERSIHFLTHVPYFQRLFV